MSRTQLDAGRLLFAGLLAFALLLRAIENFGRPLQVDEAYSLWLAGIPFGQMLTRLSSHDVHPPLFFFMLHPFSAGGFPDWFFRLIMFALSIGSLAILYWIVRLWSNLSAARIATVVAALMPSLIYYDSWVRMYALFDFEALGAMLLQTVLLTSDALKPATRRLLWVGWSIFTLASWYTLYLGFAVAAAQLLYAAIVRREALPRLVAGAGSAFVLWIPQLPTFLHQQQFGGVAFSAFRGREGVALGLLSGNAVFAQLELTTAAIVLSVIAWLWAIGAFAATVRLGPKTLLPWLGAPSALLIAFSVFAHKLLYGDRYHLIFAYALAAWSGVAIAAAWERSRYVGAALATGGAVALIAMASLRALDADYTTAPWPQIAAFLRSSERSGDALILDQGNSAWVLDRYGAIGDHPTIDIFGPPRFQGVVKPFGGLGRIWYVGFQNYPVDPSELVLNRLRKDDRLMGTWRYDRSMPTEHVFIALFAP